MIAYCNKNSVYPNQVYGFTLVEILVALTIFLMTITTIASMSSTTNTLNWQTRTALAVNEAVNAKIESLRNTPYSSLTNGTTSFVSELPASATAPRSATYTISDKSAGLKQIDISVSYTVRTKTESRQYRTYISEVTYEY